MRSLAQLGSLALALLVPWAALAWDGPDMVRLSDGSLHRGTLVESIPADHVTLREDGVERSYPASQVLYAGPALPLVRGPVRGLTSSASSGYTLPLILRAVPSSSSRGSPPPPLLIGAALPSATSSAPSPASSVTTWFTSSPSGLHLIGVAGVPGSVRTTVTALPSANVSYQGLCVTPCSTTLPGGWYQLGLVTEEGRYLRAPDTLPLLANNSVKVSYQSGSLASTLGVLLIALGGVTFAGASAFSFARSSNETQSTAALAIGIPLGILAAGLGVYLHSSATDRAVFTLEPAASYPLESH